MTADIVERLRGMAATVRNGGTLPEFADARLMQEAAQEILRLRAQADWLAQNGHADAAALLREVEG